MVNLSLSSGQFHPILSNCHPISNLSLISKIIEPFVKSRLTDFLSSNTLVVNAHQSAYCKHHSTETETAHLCIHDQLINAIGSQKISCLCLPDLSAAFDTTDHSILITRLSSWFGFRGSVLNCFKSYFSSRSFVLSVTAPSLPLVSPHVVFLRFCSQSDSVHHVHDPIHYSHFISLFKPSPLG